MEGREGKGGKGREGRGLAFRLRQNAPSCRAMAAPPAHAHMHTHEGTLGFSLLSDTDTHFRSVEFSSSLFRPPCDPPTFQPTPPPHTHTLTHTHTRTHTHTGMRRSTTHT